MPDRGSDIAGVLAACENAAHSMRDMASRIQVIEARNDAIQADNLTIATQLNATIRRAAVADADLCAARDEMQRAEAFAASHFEHANRIERQLATARADLAKIAGAVKKAFGPPPRDAA